MVLFGGCSGCICVSGVGFLLLVDFVVLLLLVVMVVLFVCGDQVQITQSPDVHLGPSILPSLWSLFPEVPQTSH